MLLLLYLFYLLLNSRNMLFTYQFLKHTASQVARTASVILSLLVIDLDRKLRSLTTVLQRTAFRTDGTVYFKYQHGQSELD
jgi:hypothetical protein